MLVSSWIRQDGTGRGTGNRKLTRGTAVVGTMPLRGAGTKLRTSQSTRQYYLLSTQERGSWPRGSGSSR